MRTQFWQSKSKTAVKQTKILFEATRKPAELIRKDKHDDRETSDINSKRQIRKMLIHVNSSMNGSQSL